MRKIVIYCIACAAAVVVGQANAWNFGDRYIDTVRYLKSGDIKFTLYESGSAGPSVRCEGGDGWFTVRRCRSGASNFTTCTAANNRMASALLTAQAARVRIMIEREEPFARGCLVTEVTLRKD